MLIRFYSDFKHELTVLPRTNSENLSPTTGRKFSDLAILTSEFNIVHLGMHFMFLSVVARLSEKSAMGNEEDMAYFIDEMCKDQQMGTGTVPRNTKLSQENVTSSKDKEQGGQQNNNRSRWNSTPNLLAHNTGLALSKAGVVGPAVVMSLAQKTSKPRSETHGSIFQSKRKKREQQPPPRESCSTPPDDQTPTIALNGFMLNGDVGMFFACRCCVFLWLCRNLHGKCCVDTTIFLFRSYAQLRMANTERAYSDATENNAVVDCILADGTVARAEGFDFNYTQ